MEGAHHANTFFKIRFQAMFYSGKFRFAQMVHFASQFAVKSDDEEEEGIKKPTASSAASKSKGTLVEITSQDAFEENCKEGAKLCVVAFLDGTSNAQEDKDHYKEVLQATLKRKGALVPNFLWIDAVCHSSFAQAFEVEPMKIPTAIVYSPSRKRYADQLVENVFSTPFVFN